MFRRNAKIALPMLLLLLLAKAAFALQSESTLRVKVFDSHFNLVSVFVARLKTAGQVIKEVESRNLTGATFTKLAQGKYVLEVEARGFKPQALGVEIKAGINEVNVTLAIAELVDSVKVEVDAQEKAIEGAFSNFLTNAQIAALPDDPREMEAELKRIAGGENVVIRVDGFSGERLPPKSQIASIRIVRSSYDAENHELGVVYVDVVTKVGNKRWSGSISFNFNDEVLNARNAFVGRRFPEQNRTTLLYFSGPVLKEKTDFSALLIDDRQLQAQNIVAFLPNGELNTAVNSRSTTTFLDLGVTHNLTKDLPIKLRYSFSNNHSDNLGVGDFNLPDRAFTRKNQSHEFRFSTAVYIAKRFLNEFRFRFTRELTNTIPQSDKPAIVVLDSFSDGGAGNLQRNFRQSFWATNNLLLGIKQHALKIGGLIFIENQSQTSAINQNGAFTFSTLQDFQLNRPSLFMQSPGVRRATVSNWQVGAFLQDDMRVSKSLVLSTGLRWEGQNNLRDNNNFSPRIAFSWSPSKSGKTVVRAGAGLFYHWLETRDLLTILNQNRFQPAATIIFNPGFPDPFSGGLRYLLPPSFLQQAEKLENPSVIHASFGLQRRFSITTNLRIEYTYQKGVHQFRSRDVNAPLLGVRPDSNFGRVSQVESSAFFVRNALNLGLNGGLTKAISYAVDYTLAKIISDGNGIFGLPADNYDLRADVSTANNDRRHRLTALLNWQIKKGLRLNAIYLMNSPLPYTITTGRDDNLDTTFNDRPPGVARNSGRGAWRNQLDLNFSWSFSFISRKGEKSDKGFSVITTAVESNAGFDLADPDKRFSLTFFATAQNALNQVNLNNFVGVQTSPFFRQATSSYPARRVTFGLRFNF